MVDVNCRAVVELVHGIGGRMQRAGRGGIVLFGSLVGFQGVPWSATYAATKGFVQSFAEGLAQELSPMASACCRSRRGLSGPASGRVPGCGWAWRRRRKWWPRALSPRLGTG